MSQSLADARTARFKGGPLDEMVGATMLTREQYAVGAGLAGAGRELVVAGWWCLLAGAAAAALAWAA